MGVQIYDSLRKEIVPLETREKGRIAMYGCGPTVYNFIHIGNARTFVWYDMIRRYLKYRGFEVTFVFNYTDVDDRIIERAAIEKIPTDGISKKYARAFEEDMAALGFEMPDILVLATEHIDDMVKAIEGLIEQGFAYEASGNVWFSVDSFDGYGKLSGRTLDDMRAGERVEPHEDKKNPLDFSLWKAAKEGEPSWSSRWGPGRPGWHIECSVMSTKYIGMSFDIHLGGSDLIFPHHENEIAQAEALEGTEPFARYWLHSGMVQMEAEKMSKSLGNVVLTREVVERYPGEVVRYWALMGSYRTQPVFSADTLDDATQAYERIRTFLQAAEHALDGQTTDENEKGDYIAKFVDAMDDDFNSAGAIAVIHELVSEGNKIVEDVQRSETGESSRLTDLIRQLKEIGSVMGLSFTVAEESNQVVEGLVEYLLELREEARAAKEFERADAIRARLAEIGVVLEDTPAGSRWRIAPNT
jgi:cysteinyl-tRNA synthetase